MYFVGQVFILLPPSRIFQTPRTLLLPLMRMAMYSDTNFLSTTPLILEMGWKCGNVPWTYAPSPLRTPSDTYGSIAESKPPDALHFVEHMDDCTKSYMHDTKLQGHNKECHVDPDACGSKLLYLHRLAPHFPNIRTIVNTLYTVWKTATSIIKID